MIDGGADVLSVLWASTQDVTCLEAIEEIV